MRNIISFVVGLVFLVGVGVLLIGIASWIFGAPYRIEIIVGSVLCVAGVLLSQLIGEDPYQEER